MRIIAGTLRRRALRVPKGHATRPTTDRTREALFSLVESRMALEGADVLDLFAGSGALGLEAISRGAAAVTSVEQQASVLKCARQNAADLEVDDYCTFIRGDAVAFLQRYNGPAFDLIVADPPYRLEAMPRLPDLALPHVKTGGLFVLEHDRHHTFDWHPALDTSRPYGRTTVSVFAHPVQDAAE